MSCIFVITQGSLKNPRWRDDALVLFTLGSRSERDERNTEWNFAFNGEYAREEEACEKKRKLSFYVEREGEADGARDRTRRRSRCTYSVRKDTYRILSCGNVRSKDIPIFSFFKVIGRTLLLSAYVTPPPDFNYGILSGLVIETVSHF